MHTNDDLLRRIEELERAVRYYPPLYPPGYTPPPSTPYPWGPFTPYPTWPVNPTIVYCAGAH